MRTSASCSSLIAKGLICSMFFFSSVSRRVLLDLDCNFSTYRRRKATAFFARRQSEKYSSLSTIDGKDGDTSVAKDTAFFTYGSFCERLESVVTSTDFSHTASSLQTKSGPFIHFDLLRSFGLNPLEVSSAGLDFVSTYLYCFTADFS